ncbi:hypothetical protein EDB19DRAFT_1836061 [Suillus lakei]|nr:hypothetical protein EDB19DRAFT_1836061 [Suillus lakei]
MQLFQAGLFPASFTRPKTAFTFSVLDDFLLDNLECGTSAINYYSKICRLTLSIFPLMVPDRYRELMRAARQWRQCKLYKWHGFAHKDDKPNDGDLALFCLACLQPGINLDLSAGTVAQLDNTPSWLMTRYLVMDGNFKAEHMHPVNASDEVPLMDGLGFMVSNERYKSHLAIAQDHVQRSDCNNHQAVNQANASRQRLEATNIGGCACAWHGCFVPHSMVDFQKGERQMNMDYALSQALNYKTNGISCAITFYDINCQYNKYLKDQIASSMYLSIPNWFVACTWTSRQLLCPDWQDRWRDYGDPLGAFEHNLPIGQEHGNSPSQGAKFLSRKLKEAIKGSVESKLAFHNLNEMAHPDMVILWEAEETLAHENRAKDPTAMDIYEVRLEKGKSPTRKQQELRLLQAQNHHEHPDIHPPGLTNLMKEEIILHEGQANDALHAIRVHWGDKPVLFCNTVRIYSKCWSQLAKLPDHNLLRRCLPLKKEDLKASSAVANPNARGQRDTTLSWFWSLDVQGDTSGNGWMTEFYRVNWLRMKALRNRWNEELILVKHEMQWSINFFHHRAKQWLSHMHNATSAGLTGHTCYAAQQSHIYDQLAAHAEDSFRKMIIQLEVPVPVEICLSPYNITFLSMNNTATLIPSDQVIIATKGNHIITADISRALFYANSRLLAMHLHVDKSFATAMPGYAQAFYTLMKWEMETFVTPFINDTLGIGRVSDMLPKSSVQDVMDLVGWHFSHLPDHVRTGLLPYILQGPDDLKDKTSSASLAQCHQMINWWRVGGDIAEQDDESDTLM